MGPRTSAATAMLVFALAQGLGLAFAPPAHAQTKDASALKLACVQASDKAQQLRAAGKLVASRNALQACVLDACPRVVREACSQWLGEVTASLPSIVIGAKDADGKDLLDVKVTIDGELATATLDGRALPIDPGRHKMRYEKADGTVLEEEILVGEGTKNRAVAAVFPATKAPAAAVAATPEPAAKGSSSANTAVWVTLAVVGVGSLGTALGLDVTTTSNVNALKSSPCAKTGSCSSSTVSGYELDYDLAGVALGVGVAAVGAALYVLIAHPLGTATSAASPSSGQPAQASKMRPTFRVVPTAHGGALALTF